MRHLKSPDNKTESRKKNGRITIIRNNSIDKEIQAMLRPLNLMQSILLSPKYCIKKNLIIPNSLFATFVSLLGLICIIYFYFYRLVHQYSDKELRQYLNIAYITSCFDTWYYCLSLFLSSIIIIVQVKYNIKFVLTFQIVHKLLYDKKKFNLFTVGNWVYVLCIFGFYSILAIIWIMFYKNFPLYNWIAGLFLIRFDANIIYSIRCIQSLKDKMNLWNEELLNQSLTNRFCYKTYCKNMFVAYTNIIECYNIYKTTNKLMVILLITLDLVIISLASCISSIIFINILDFISYNRLYFTCNATYSDCDTYVKTAYF